MTQKTGALIFDETADRYDIRFDVNDYYGGLHCGDCFEVFVRGKWKPTRMRELAKRTLAKIAPLTENEYAELAIFAADEV